MKFTYPPESKPLDGYTIKRAIHRGGFGEVYYALSDAGKEVALKLLHQNTDVELRGVRQCLNLKHPNLVTIFDIRTDADNDHWIVMEYVSGKGLDQVIADHPDGMLIEDVQWWLSGIVAGLSYLHDRGIVHRDLKPANVYHEHDQVKIGDVGLSKFISESRRAAQTQSVGTVYYMAPEVAHGRYGREVDIYGLGIMLYEMLTGRVPFEGETTGEILMKHLSEKPDLGPIPKRLRPVLARALEKDPLRRTPDAAQLEQEFRRAVLGYDVAQDIPEESFVTTSNPPRSTPNDVEPRQEAVREPLTGRQHHRRLRRRLRSVRRHLTGWDDDGHGARPRHGHRRHEPTHRAAPAQPVDWRKQRGFWLRVVALAILVLALVSPVGVLGLTGRLFGAGILLALGYGVFRLAQLFASSANEVFVRKNPVRGAKPETKIFVDVDPPAAAAEPVPPKPAPKKHHRHPLRLLTPETLRTIPLRHRLTDLSGSLTFAVLCTAIITAGLSLLGFLAEPSSIGFFGVTTLLAAWAVLIASKFWEGSKTDAILRRLSLLLAGVAVGTGTYWLDQTLMVELAPGGSLQAHALIEQIGAHPLSHASQPTLAGYMVFFAGLFGLRRWWRHADSFRMKQYRISSALLTLLLGYLLTAVLPFPYAWGMIWALAISSVVQLSAVWVPPEQRDQLMETRSDATG